MGLNAEELSHALEVLAQRDSRIAAALARYGAPAPRHREPGHATLLRTIVGQQVSVAAARSMWARLEAHIGPEIDPRRVLASDFDSLRSCGLSRQKQAYARSLCELVVTGELDLTALPADDEGAIALLTRIKGVGRWSAEIYLLFAEGRSDVWPAGDLGVQAGLHRILGLDARPAEKAARMLSEAWRPHRGALAVLTWHVHDSPA